jgi:hypothetical protein
VINSEREEHRRRWRWTIGVAVTLFWAAMMFSLVRDRVLPQRRAQELAAQSVEPAALVERWQDLEEGAWVRYGGKDVGSGVTRITRMPGEAAGYDVDIRFGFNLGMFDLTRQIQIKGRAELGSKFELVRFHLEGNLQPLRLAVTGEATSEELRVEIRRNGIPSRARYRLDRAISLLDAVRPQALRHFKVEPGASIAVPVADPVWSMELGTLKVSVLGSELIDWENGKREAFRVESSLNDFVSTSWVDTSGTTLRRQLVGGFVMDQADPRIVILRNPGLKEPAAIRSLQASDFAKLPLQDIKSLTERKSSPLSVIGTFSK